MSFTHGLEDQRFKNDLTVKGITQKTSGRRQLFKQDAHHIAVGRKGPQLTVGSDTFRRFIQHQFRLRQQGTQLHGTQSAQQFFKKGLKIFPLAGKFRHHHDHSGRIVAQHGSRQRIQIPLVRQTEKGKHLFPGDGGAVSVKKEGDHLIQQGLGITHTAFGGTGDGGDSGRFHRHIFSLGDQRKSFSDQLGGNGLQIKPLTAGNDRGQHLVHFGRGKNKFYVGGRLFDGFQENVPRHFGKHVDFVDDIDLVLAAHRTGKDIFSQFTHGLRIVAAGGVDFDDIKRTLLRHGTAVFTLTAGFAVHRRKAVECFGKNTGQSGFTDPPGTHKKIGVAGTVPGDRIAQRPHNVLLPHNISETAGTPFPGYDLIFAHLIPASIHWRCSSKICFKPCSARSRSSFMRLLEKVPCSAVPWISMNSPDSAIMTFISTSARESSS